MIARMNMKKIVEIIALFMYIAQHAINYFIQERDINNLDKISIL